MYCDICGRPSFEVHHLIFGTAYRKLADEDKLCINICSRCHTTGRLGEKIHDTPVAEKLSKMLGQAIYERNKCEGGASVEEARKSFIKRYGKSWL